MSDRARARSAAVAAGAVGLTAIASGALALWLNRRVMYGNDVFLWGLFTATALAFAGAGLAILRRSTVYVIGWLCLLTGGALELSLLLSHYGIYTLVVAPGSLPAPGAALAFAEPLPWVYLGGLILIALLFPTGHLVSPRWRWCVVATVGALVASASKIAQPHVITDIWSDELSHVGARAADPLGVPAFARVTESVIEPLGGVLLSIAAVTAVVSLFVRRRRASVEERHQIRWLAFVAGAAVAWIVVMIPIMALTEPSDGSDGIAAKAFWLVITPLVALGPPIAIGIGIVKYRLFDIDVVIRKTVVVAVVAFCVTFGYLAVVVLTALGPVTRGVFLFLLVALTLRPMRRAARAVGDRVAYGKRATNYEVLSDFAERISDTYAADDVLPRMATVLAEGVGAEHATVWLRVGGELRPAASAGRTPPLAPAALDGDELPDLGHDALEIRQAGDLLGALSVAMPSNDPLDAARRGLIQDMAAQAGLVLRNVRLIEELKDSRKRLVAAQDEERRKLERDLHDGVQQQLVALAVKLRLADTLVERDAAAAHVSLAQLQTDAQRTLDDLRDLARGIYPPLLADQGLAAALEAQARRASLPVTLVPDGIGRYGRDVEATVYFCTLEALNNVAKYADASAATIELGEADGALTFAVRDDGAGFDTGRTSYGTGLQGMADRLDAVGGSLAVESAPGAGTTVTGRVPVV